MLKGWNARARPSRAWACDRPPRMRQDAIANALLLF